MSSPIALGGQGLPPSPVLDKRQAVDARSAPATPGHRLPVVDKSKVDPELLKAAEGMEAMFVDYLLKVMRETVPKNDMDLESPATNIYRSMLDSEFAKKAAHVGGIGLAEQMIAYMESQRYNLPKGQEAPKESQ